MIARSVERYRDPICFLVRLLVGLLFFQHGAQKLFGWFGDRPPVPLATLLGVAGAIELVGGLCVVVGLGVRIVSFICAGEMVVAYGMAHLPHGWIPIQNKGELALLYCAAFLAIMMMGGGGWSLDKKFTSR